MSLHKRKVFIWYIFYSLTSVTTLYLHILLILLYHLNNTGIILLITQCLINNKDYNHLPLKIDCWSTVLTQSKQTIYSSIFHSPIGFRFLLKYTLNHLYHNCYYILISFSIRRRYDLFIHFHIKSWNTKIYPLPKENNLSKQM